MTTPTRSPRLARWPAAVVASLAAVPLVASGAFAQAPAAAPAPEPSRHCFSDSRLIRGLGGATLGGWLGFVTVKIKLSDWNDRSRSGSATRTRNQATLAGAAVGALIGSLVPHRGCAANAVASAVAPPERPVRQPITAEEIRRSGASGSVYDVVYALRRTWLNDRGVEDMSEAPHVGVDASGQQVIVPGEPRLIVYLDNMRLGTVGELRNLPTTGVVAIRYYDPSQANLRWGAGHSHGAIQVLTVLEQAPR